MDYRMIVILILIILCPQVYAREFIDISCENQEEVYECEISGNIDYDITAIDFHFSLPEYAKVLDYEKDSRWEGIADDNWVSFYSAEYSKGRFPILTLKIESDSSLKSEDINIYDIKVYDDNYQKHEIKQTNISEQEKKEEKSKKNNNKKLLIITICVIIILGIIASIIKLKGDSK